VESNGVHADAILLLDEPGLSLHPLAQRDLSAFFENLASTNQIVYTTHSPFLVDADMLDRVRKVFVSEDGSTKSRQTCGRVAIILDELELHTRSTPRST
jgi:predicted ATP-dependent endonuclease of OLD family